MAEREGSPRPKLGINYTILPTLGYREARIAIPGESGEARVWVAAHDGGYLAKNPRDQRIYGFFMPEDVTLR